MVGSCGDRPGRLVKGFSENVLDRCDEAKESDGDNGDGRLDDAEEAVEMRDFGRRGRGSAATAGFVADMVACWWILTILWFIMVLR